MQHRSCGSERCGTVRFAILTCQFSSEERKRRLLNKVTAERSCRGFLSTVLQKARTHTQLTAEEEEQSPCSPLKTFATGSCWRQGLTEEHLSTVAFHRFMLEPTFLSQSCWENIHIPFSPRQQPGCLPAAPAAGSEQRQAHGGRTAGC